MSVLDLSRLSRDTVLNLLADHLYESNTSASAQPSTSRHGAFLPPIRRVLNAAGRLDAIFADAYAKSVLPVGTINEFNG